MAPAGAGADAAGGVDGVAFAEEPVPKTDVVLAPQVTMAPLLCFKCVWKGSVHEAIYLATWGVWGDHPLVHHLYSGAQASSVLVLGTHAKKNSVPSAPIHPHPLQGPRMTPPQPNFWHTKRDVCQKVGSSWLSGTLPDLAGDNPFPQLKSKPLLGHRSSSSFV